MSEESHKSQLFRQAALDRLASPDQLDRMVVVTDARGWLTLATLLVLVVAGLLWSLFGKVPYNVTGHGILVSQDGRIYSAMSETEGYVSKTHVRINDHVEKGQLIAEIQQDTLRQSADDAEELYQERLAERQQVAATQAAELELKESNYARQKQSQRQIAKVARKRVDYLQEILEQREEMVNSGLIARDAVEETREQFNKISQELSAANNRILEIEAIELDLRTRHEKTLFDLDQEITESARLAMGRAERLERVSRIVAPATGTVTEIRVTEGTVVAAGHAIVSVASGGRFLQVVLYLPTRDGKKVKPGMAVRVEPATVRKEEFGMLIGEVTEISDYPSSPEGMLAVLQNQVLVERFSNTGAPYAARVNLTPDIQTVSGYLWTSNRGPDLQISAGTTVQAEVTVREVPPISLFIPMLRSLFQ